MKISGIVVGTLILGAAQLATVAEGTAPSVVGHLVGGSPEAQGPIFATRELQFDETVWYVTFRGFADPSARQPPIRIEARGVYVLGDASARVVGNIDGIFPATHRALTEQSAGDLTKARPTTLTPFPLVEKVL